MGYIIRENITVVSIQAKCYIFRQQIHTIHLSSHKKIKCPYCTCKPIGSRCNISFVIPIQGRTAL